MTMTDVDLTLADAAKPFPAGYVERDRDGNDYVEHSVVTQRLLEVFGHYSLTDVTPIRGHAPAIKSRSGNEWPAQDNAIVGCLLTLSVKLGDGTYRTVVEAGDVDNPAMHDTDGVRLKLAISDAIKRCAMRLGVGLHLWAQDRYYLDRSLARRLESMPPGDDT